MSGKGVVGAMALSSGMALLLLMVGVDGAGRGPVAVAGTDSVGEQPSLAGDAAPKAHEGVRSAMEALAAGAVREGRARCLELLRTDEDAEVVMWAATQLAEGFVEQGRLDREGCAEWVTMNVEPSLAPWMQLAMAQIQYGRQDYAGAIASSEALYRRGDPVGYTARLIGAAARYAGGEQAAAMAIATALSDDADAGLFAAKARFLIDRFCLGGACTAKQSFQIVSFGLAVERKRAGKTTVGLARSLPVLPLLYPAASSPVPVEALQPSSVTVPSSGSADVGPVHSVRPLPAGASGATAASTQAETSYTIGLAAASPAARPAWAPALTAPSGVRVLDSGQSVSPMAATPMTSLLPVEAMSARDVSPISSERRPAVPVRPVGDQTVDVSISMSTPISLRAEGPVAMPQPAAYGPGSEVPQPATSKLSLAVADASMCASGAVMPASVGALGVAASADPATHRIAIDGAMRLPVQFETLSRATSPVHASPAPLGDRRGTLGPVDTVSSHVSTSTGGDPLLVAQGRVASSVAMASRTSTVIVPTFAVPTVAPGFSGPTAVVSATALRADLTASAASSFVLSDILTTDEGQQGIAFRPVRAAQAAGQEWAVYSSSIRGVNMGAAASAQMFEGRFLSPTPPLPISAVSSAPMASTIGVSEPSARLAAQAASLPAVFRAPVLSLMLSPAGVSSPVSVSPTATAEGTASPLATSGVAIAQLDEFNKKVSSDVVQGLVQKGNALFQKGDVAGARGAYAEGVALAGRLNVSSNAAEKLVQTFITEEGIQTTECREWVASRLRGKSLQVRMELAIGEMFYRRQEYDKAIEAMQPVADDGGMSAQLAGLIIAMSLSEQGKKAEAMEKLRTIADDPQVSEASAKAQFLIAWMHLQTQEYAQAREAFDKLVRNFPRSPLASKAAGLSKRLAGMGAK